MTCSNCGMPADGRLCRDCELMEHQEDYYGTVDESEDGDDDE